MLDALKVLELRRHGTQPAAAPEPVSAPTVPAEPIAEPAHAPAAAWHETSYVVAPGAAAELPPAPYWGLAPETRPSGCVACCLPTTVEVAEGYLTMAGTIADQVAANYCNVLQIVSPDRYWERGFSLTHLAQAFALQSPGDVLLVDGDLRDRRLSRTVGLTGPGLADVMLGVAAWADVIHPTSSQAIDFVASGDRSVPTFERSQFGWHALRPQYRLVLIGVAPADQPETAWLAARCDGVYLLLSRPDTRRKAAIASVNALRACGANVLGCVVVND